MKRIPASRNQFGKAKATIDNTPKRKCGALKCNEETQMGAINRFSVMKNKNVSSNMKRDRPGRKRKWDESKPDSKRKWDERVKRKWSAFPSLDETALGPGETQMGRKAALAAPAFTSRKIEHMACQTESLASQGVRFGTGFEGACNSLGALELR